MTRRTLVLAALALSASLAGGAMVRAAQLYRPEILEVIAPGRLTVGQLGEVRVTYRAPRANVVAVIQEIEDLDGPRRATRQREIGVVAAAFGRDAGQLRLPIAFETPGQKRVGLTLVTDERDESAPASVEIEVAP